VFHLAFSSHFYIPEPVFSHHCKLKTKHHSRDRQPNDEAQAVQHCRKGNLTDKGISFVVDDGRNEENNKVEADYRKYQNIVYFSEFLLKLRKFKQILQTSSLLCISDCLIDEPGKERSKDDSQETDP
jgi:hypothetical protein